MTSFTHLHLHTQYSLLDGAVKIGSVLDKVKEYGMSAIAVTDHGNMFGILDFLKEIEQFNKDNSYHIKPIIGCEIYVAPASRFEKNGKQDRSGAHLILLAKNINGYRNLSKIVSLGYLEGFYYTPRVDKDLLRQYSKDLIAMTACIGGEVPETIIRSGSEKAEIILKEYIDIFGEDLYLELQRTGIPEQAIANNVLIEFAKKYNLKLVATNDVHFINSYDFDAHHILICLNTNKSFDDVDTMQYTGQEYFKSPEEMSVLFSDVPEAIENTNEIVNKIEEYDLKRSVILPIFPIPEGYETGDEYLSYLTFEGAKVKYREISEELQERLDFELSVIKKMNYAGYFLIVQDFINEAKKNDVFVGPGRGSATGSAVAYCIGITNIDPIKYNLLFERFLNPDRVSMPDIDVDFDDEGRDKVLKYVINKYGKEKVAQIVTFGTMAARSSIRDVARVLKLPLPEADRLAKLVPEGPKVTLKKSIIDVPELHDARKNSSDLIKKTLNFAETLEGSARHTGLHACGVIIGPDNLIEYIPLCTAKDSELAVTQYEGELVESVGMLKMDFLGLKTLSILKDALYNIRKSNNIDIDLDNIPLDDEKTFQLFQQGKTYGVFQFESEGMRTYLKELIPTNFEDIIAMNALHRPGPMGNIPSYIGRKHGTIKIEYPHPMTEDILKNTYGIMVYQEQIMQISQVVGGFSKGNADELRKAMGHKIKDKIETMRANFIDGAEQKNINRKKAEEIYETMSRFGEYGFNRSHSAAYSVIAFQTAYLKAHYPAEFMASVLTHNLNDIKEITKYIEECKRLKVHVLGPDVNESEIKFTVNHKGEIRFGLGAVKNLGEAAADAIISERNLNGPFSDIFDFTLRVNLRAVNKKSIESLIYSGAFDSFENIHRAQYFYTENGQVENFVDLSIRYGNKLKDASYTLQNSLFGDSPLVKVTKPSPPKCEPWPKFEILKYEKEYLGFFVSGHPLDEYKMDIENFCNTKITDLKQNLKSFYNKTVKIAGMVTEVQVKTDKTDKKYGTIIIEDYSDSIRLFLFQENYLKFKHLLETGLKLFITCAVIPRFRDSRDMTIDVREIQLLSNVRDNLLKSVTIFVNLHLLDEDLITGLGEIIKEHKGKCRIIIKMHDFKNKLNLDMFSTKYMVDPVNDFFEKLNDMSGISFKLN